MSSLRPPEASSVAEGVGAPAVEPQSVVATSEGVANGPAPVPRVRKGGEALYFAFRNKKLVVGFTIILLFLVAAVVGPMFVDHGPNEYVGMPMQSPSSEYWLGTTFFGQDVFAQFAHGLRATFLVGILGGGIAAVIGMVVGFTAGYRGGFVDEMLNMLTNVMLVIPTLAVLLIIAAYLSVRGVMVEALFIGFTSWPWAARAIRAQTFSLASRDFVDLARMSGGSVRRIIFKEIAPNMSSYLVMTFILLFGGAVLIAATLDFIGLGPTSGTSLGLMMNNAVQWSALQLGLWWWFIPPGIGITAIVGSLYVMNVGLDEVFNPKLREM
jgi:peptide/nickel transport system permease protein